MNSQYSRLIAGVVFLLVIILIFLLDSSDKIDEEISNKNVNKENKQLLKDKDTREESVNSSLRELNIKNSSFRLCIARAAIENARIRDGISSVKELKELICQDRYIGTIEGIEALEGLEHLNIEDNEISNIAPLTSLKNLRRLNIKNNKVEMIAALRMNRNLEYLNIEGNPVIDSDTLNYFPNLKEVVFQN